MPKSEYGDQLWNKNSIHKNQDGFIRVLSKFVPKNSSNNTEDILYTIEIDCTIITFRDVEVNADKYNQYYNRDSTWKDPNGDKLIIGIIKNVCAFVN